MVLLNIIRPMHLRRKLSIREMSRPTGLSRNTVARHLAAHTIEPIFATPERPIKLDPHAEKLAAWLKPVQLAVRLTDEESGDLM